MSQPFLGSSREEPTFPVAATAARDRFFSMYARVVVFFQFLENLGEFTAIITCFLVPFSFRQGSSEHADCGLPRAGVFEETKVPKNALKYGRASLGEANRASIAHRQTCTHRTTLYRHLICA